MSWQDELRQLDARLAAGTIDHSQHRKLRDELLAVASGGGIAPMATQSAWQSTNPSHELGPESGSSARLLATDRPTSARSPADDRHTDALGFPPVTDVHSWPVDPPQTPPTTSRAGQPQSNPRSAGRTKPVWLFLALGVFLTLAMIITAAWWFGSDIGGSERGRAIATGEAPQASRPALADRLPELPGSPNPKSSTMSIDRGLALGLYSAQDAERLESGAAEKIIYRGSVDGGIGYMLLVIPVPTQAAADRMVAGLRQSAARSGFDQMTGGASGVFRRITADGQVVGTWYTSNRFAVGVGLSASSATDQQALLGRLQDTVRSVSQVLPPR